MQVPRPPRATPTHGRGPRPRLLGAQHQQIGGGLPQRGAHQAVHPALEQNWRGDTDHWGGQPSPWPQFRVNLADHLKQYCNAFDRWELRVATDHGIAVIVVVGINVELLELCLFTSLAWYLAIISSVQCSYVSRVHWGKQGGTLWYLKCPSLVPPVYSWCDMPCVAVYRDITPTHTPWYSQLILAAAHTIIISNF